MKGFGLKSCGTVAVTGTLLLSAGFLPQTVHGLCITTNDNTFTVKVNMFAGELGTCHPIQEEQSGSFQERQEHVVILPPRWMCYSRDVHFLAGRLLLLHFLMNVLFLPMLLASMFTNPQATTCLKNVVTL